MSRRTTVIESLIAYISDSTGCTGHRGMKFLHELNSFPSFYVHATGESRVHIGDGTTYGMLSLAIRGYQWSESLDDVDAFGRTLETAIESFYADNREIVEEARITSFRTDEGVMEPYGVVDILVTIVYDALDGINQAPKFINYILQDSTGTAIQTPSGVNINVPSTFK